MNLDDASDVHGRSLPRPTRKRIPDMVRIGGVFCEDTYYNLPGIRFKDVEHPNSEVRIIRKPKRR